MSNQSEEVTPPDDKDSLARRRVVGRSRSNQSWPEEWVGSYPTRENVWSLLSFFELPVNAEKAIKTALQKQFGYPIEDFPHTYAAAGLTKRPVPIRIEPLSAVYMMSAAESVSVSIRHARQYMRAAADSPVTVKPTFLYYGCLALARAVVASIFRLQGGFPAAHGMKFDRRLRQVAVEPRGEIADLHDATFTLPLLYNSRRYDLDKIIRITRAANAAMTRVTGEQKHDWQTHPGMPQVDDIGGKPVTAHVLTWQMIATFALSNFSRYAPHEWEAILRGERDGRAHAYTVFMEEVEISFPLEVARLLSETRYTFGPSPADNEAIQKATMRSIARVTKGLVSP